MLLIDILTEIDKLANGLVTGNSNHTISYELGVAAALGNMRAVHLCAILAKILGPNHCADAVKNEGGMPTP